jgi:hypothetical protein
MSNEDLDKLNDTLSCHWGDTYAQLADMLRGCPDQIDLSSEAARELLGQDFPGEDRVLIDADLVLKALQNSAYAQSPESPQDATDCDTTLDTNGDTATRHAANAKALGANGSFPDTPPTWASGRHGLYDSLYLLLVAKMIEFRRVPGYAGYRVSTTGRVQTNWSTGHNPPFETGRWREMGLARHRDGYRQVSLRRKSKRTTEVVHRLVLLAFVGPAPAGHECRHLNGNPSDNRLENLVWGPKRDRMKQRLLAR